MTKIIICKGLPASGKSTWAKDFVSKNHDWKRINKDDLRAMIQDSTWTPKLEKQIINTRDTLIRMWLMDGFNVIVDDTNLNPIHEDGILKIANEFQAIVEIKRFDVDVEVAIERDLKREKSVGEKVIRDMFNKWIRTGVNLMLQDKSLPKAIIVDIDGTVAKMNGRGAFEWDKVGTDLPKQPIIDIVKKFADSHKVIFASGRDGICYNDTMKWINDNIDIASYELFMRPVGDMRKDCIVKEELFDKFIRDKYYIDFVLDDRQQVVDMWRGLGLTCLQVDYGNF